MLRYDRYSHTGNSAANLSFVGIAFPTSMVGRHCDLRPFITDDDAFAKLVIVYKNFQTFP